MAPAALHPWFKSVVVNGVKKLYVSDAANDLWIREIVFPNLRSGYFVEVGAADGMAGSSCYVLEKHFDWRGICIEPHGKLFELLTRSRSRSIHENVCVADKAGWVDFAAFDEDQGVHPCLSGIRQVLLTLKSGGDAVLEKASIVRKRAVPLADLLRKNNAPHQIEYGAFDIEGSEFEALRSFPFEEYRFLALTLEVNPSTRELLSELLQRNGYREVVNPFNQDQPWETYWLHETVSVSAP